MFIGNPNLKATKRTKPIQSALCKPPVQGIVVAAKPTEIPKPAPLPAPKVQLNGRPEHLQPLSKISVPVIAKTPQFQNVKRCTGPIVPLIVGKPINNAKPATSCRSPRVWKPEELESTLASIMALLTKRSPKHTFLAKINQTIKGPDSKTKPAIRLGIERGLIRKEQGDLQPNGNLWAKYYAIEQTGWTNRI